MKKLGFIPTLWSTTAPASAATKVDETTAPASAEVEDERDEVTAPEQEEQVIDYSTDEDEWEVMDDQGKLRGQLKEANNLLAQKNAELEDQRIQHAKEIESCNVLSKQNKTQYGLELEQRKKEYEVRTARLQGMADEATKRNKELENRKKELEQAVADVKREGQVTEGRLQAQLTSQRATIETSKRELDRVNKLLHKNEEQLKSTQVELEKQKQELKALQSQYEASARRATTEKQNCEKASTEAALLRQRLADSSEERSQVEGVGQELREEVKRNITQLKELQQSLDAANEFLRESQLEAQENAAQLRAEQNAHNETREKAEKARAQAERACGRVEELEAISHSVVDLEQELKKARDALSAARMRAEEAELNIATERSAKDHMKHELDKITAQEVSNQEKINLLKDNVKQANECKEQMRRERDALQNELLKEKERIEKEKQILSAENQRLQKELDQLNKEKEAPVPASRTLQQAAANAEKKARVERMFEQYPGRRPIKCHKGQSLSFADLKRFKYAVPQNMTMEKFLGYIRDKLKIEDQTVGIHLRIMSGGMVVEDADLKKTIDDYYRQYMADDGCLHIQYNALNESKE